MQARKEDLRICTLVRKTVDCPVGGSPMLQDRLTKRRKEGARWFLRRLTVQGLDDITEESGVVAPGSIEGALNDSLR